MAQIKYTLEEKTRLYYADHPYEYIVDVIGVRECSVSESKWFAMTEEQKDSYRKRVKINPEITWQQKKVLDVLPECIKNKKSISIRSGHGIGKSALVSWIIIWATNNFPFIKIPCTSGKEKQIKDILWSELAKWHRQLPEDEKANNNWTATEYRNTKYGADWFAVARTASSPENMQGFHAPYIMFLIDEAPAVEHKIFEVIKGALTTEGAIMLMTGNPTLLEGEFFESHTKKRHIYKTFNFSSEDSPLADKDNAQMWADDYGVDSDVYRVRVLGEFPLAGENVFISMADVEKAVKRIDKDYVKVGVINVGVDPARYGDDETGLCVRRGNKIIHEEQWSKKSIPETIGRVYGFIIKSFKGLGFKVVISIDDTGLGGGVTDGLRYNVERDGHSDWIKIVPENFGGAPVLKNDRGILLYNNRGTEMWAYIRDNIRNMDLPDDSELISQLSTRKYRINRDGRIELERKEEMKKRGLKSPDRADALALTFSDCIRNDAELVMI